MINSSFKVELQSYLNQEELQKVETLAKSVAGLYSDTDGWHPLQRSPRAFGSLIQQVGEMPPPKPRPGDPWRVEPDLPRVRDNSRSHSALFVPLGMRIYILDQDGESLFRRNVNQDELSKDQFFSRVPIVKEGNTIGWLAVLQSRQVSNRLAESFMYSQTANIFTATVAAFVLTLIIAFITVKYLLTPLGALHRGATEIANGNLDHRIEQIGNDELTDLISSFNLLAASLAKQKEIREQWLSDISHELRTPVAVLRGEIEALQDGIRPMETKYLEGLHAQVTTLTQLIDDLHSLSISSDSAFRTNHRNDVVLADIMDDLLARFELRFASKSLSVAKEYSSSIDTSLYVDAKLIQQVFQNLFENCFRYTNERGNIRITLQSKANELVAIIEDSAPGVPDESLPKLFDRLYRVDSSRSRASGGSGLGLAICQNIVEAHQGTIEASHSSLGGVKVVVRLPKQQ
ncbi:ATP-binding protein [Vibrio wakamikoensis]|uniref:ATP-binding protein n=1 Tax=Vibrio TaxID=662 RepID=UPI003AB6793E